MSSPSIVRAVNDALKYETVTIANGASLSGAINLGRYRLGMVIMPSAWTAADLTFQVSHNGTDYSNLHISTSDTEYTVQADASRAIIIPLTDFLSVQYLKVRSGTSAAAVNQGAARTITLILVP